MYTNQKSIPRYDLSLISKSCNQERKKPQHAKISMGFPDKLYSVLLCACGLLFGSFVTFTLNETASVLLRDLTAWATFSVFVLTSTLGVAEESESLVSFSSIHLWLLSVWENLSALSFFLMKNGKIHRSSWPRWKW